MSVPFVYRLDLLAHRVWLPRFLAERLCDAADYAITNGEIGRTFWLRRPGLDE